MGHIERIGYIAEKILSSQFPEMKEVASRFSQITEAVNARRLEIARNLLLRRSDLTIQQVCFESGFKDIPYFFRLFKRAEGVTPRMYRKEKGGHA